MMLKQIRRDRAFRHLGPWVVASAVIAPLLMGIGVDRIPAMTPDVAPSMMVFGLWVGLALYLAFGARRRGSSLLDLALPIPARRLWLVHVLAAALGGLVVLGSSLAALAFRGWVEGWPAWVLALAAVRLIPLLMAGHVLAVVALASHRPHLFEVPAEDARVFLAVLLVWILPLLSGLAAVPPGWALVFYAAAATLGWRTWRRLPPALALLPREAALPAPGAGDRKTRRERRRPGAPAAAGRWHPADLHRRSASGFAVVVLLGFLFFEGVLLSDPTQPASYRLGSGLWVLGLWSVGAHGVLKRLAMLDLLPVSRRVLFAAMALRPMAAVVLGFALGAVFRRSLDETSAIFILLLGVLWLGGVTLFLDSFHAQSWRLQGVLVPATVVAVIFLGVAVEKNWMGFSALPEFAEALLRRLAVVSSGSTAVLVLLAVLLLVYAQAEARFRRFEVPPPRGGGA